MKANVRKVKCVLSVGMIVKNEGKYLEKCLSALQPLLRNTRSELIIVDTGSTDRTVEIAKDFTKKVYHFDWTNDFAAARNFGLGKCSGQWFMFLDADEIFDTDMSEMIRFFNDSNMLKNYNSAYYQLRNYSGVYEGLHNQPEVYRNRPYAPQTVMRIAKIKPGFAFEGEIHERFNVFYEPVYTFKTFANHFGYVYDTKSERDTKLKRNADLLVAEIDANKSKYDSDPKHSLWLLAHLVESFAALDDVKGVLGIEPNTYITKTLKVARNLENKNSFNLVNLAKPYLSVANYYYFRKEYEKVIEIVDEYIECISKIDDEEKLKLHLIDAYAFKAFSLAQLERASEITAIVQTYLEYYDKIQNGEFDLRVLSYHTSNYYSPEMRKRLLELSLNSMLPAINENLDESVSKLPKVLSNLNKIPSKPMEGKPRKFHLQTVLETVAQLRRLQHEEQFADCQEIACLCCDFIDGNVGVGTKTVARLEAYCELVFKVNAGEAKIADLDKELDSIQRSAKVVLKSLCSEIVFISYKSSMSDTLESIYHAAKADSDCDVYWIPVPYYKVNPDNTLGEMQFEGVEHYGKNIECTNWQEYDISTRHPDVIYTFNPYDGNNYITRIHRDFYCERLREFTERLVYVPYFIVEEINAVELSSEMILQPGVLYSHKVVIQSENIRNRYIGCIKEFEKSNNCIGKFGDLESKLVVFGSPKLDKISKKEDYTLPESWSEIISGKKIVLYNTSCSNTILSGKQMLAKIRSVIKLFSKRDDVVLWWRPHPLSGAIYESMLPCLAKEYTQFIDEYKASKIGIYDDTADLHRAIALSDCYYGDKSSSLVPMYNETGKPVMFQNVYSIDSDENKFSLKILAFDIKDGVVWFLEHDVNGIFTLNLETKAVKLVTLLPSEFTFTTLAYNTLDVVDDYVILTPYTSNSIVRYSISTDSFDFVELPPNNQEHNNYYSSACKIGECIYVFPYSYEHRKIIKYDIKSNKVSFETKICDELKKANISSQPMFATSGGNGVITIVCDNTFVKYDTVSGNHTLHQIEKADDVCWNIAKIDDTCWSSMCNGDIIKWNETTGEHEVFNNNHLKYKYEGYPPYTVAISIENKIFMLPAFSNIVLRIDNENLSNPIEVFKDLEERTKKSFESPLPMGNYGCYSHAIEYEGSIFTFSNIENALQKIEPTTGEIENIPLELGLEDYELLKQKSLHIIPESCDRLLFLFESLGVIPPPNALVSVLTSEARGGAGLASAVSPNISLITQKEIADNNFCGEIDNKNVGAKIHGSLTL
ncbi:MAG: glycosyltransferase family 2 protein [Oscillospiraceae bacterium]|nr:glycosyltransferase family 2 protein [Oscillospiraceae bacterium]